MFPSSNDFNQLTPTISPQRSQSQNQSSTKRQQYQQNEQSHLYQKFFSEAINYSSNNIDNNNVKNDDDQLDDNDDGTKSAASPLVPQQQQLQQLHQIVDEEQLKFQQQDAEFPYFTLRKVVNLPRKIKKNKKVLIDLSDTKYEVIKHICTTILNWTVIGPQQQELKFPHDDFWNIRWSDNYIHEEDLRRMMPFQRINHFPGSHQLGRKNNLAKNLTKMKLLFPDLYDFYPKTWILPQQHEELKEYYYQKQQQQQNNNANQQSKKNITGCGNTVFTNKNNTDVDTSSGIIAAKEDQNGSCNSYNNGQQQQQLHSQQQITQSPQQKPKQQSQQYLQQPYSYPSPQTIRSSKSAEYPESEVELTQIQHQQENIKASQTQSANCRNKYQNNGKCCFIVKPEASCQGKGIFLTDSFEQMTNQEHCVVQEYIAKPLLIDKLKFDFRVYVLLKCINPLQIYMYTEGLARFATVPYQPPGSKNFSNLQMHLTNYAINKKNPEFIFNDNEYKDDLGHKRSFSAVMKYLYYQGKDVASIYAGIKDIIIKSIISVQSQLIYNYKQCQQKEEYNNLCFEILGFDIMLDENLKPWLIEINHTPSFQTDTPLDHHIKKNLLLDTLIMLNLQQEKKIYYEYKSQQKGQKQQIINNNKMQQNISPQIQLQQQQQMQQTQQNQLQSEIKPLQYSSKLQLGAYIKIFPQNKDEICKDYQQLIDAGYKIWLEHFQKKNNCNQGSESPQKLNLYNCPMDCSLYQNAINQKKWSLDQQKQKANSINNSKSYQISDEDVSMSNNSSPLKGCQQQLKQNRQKPNYIQQNKDFLKDKNKEIYTKTCISYNVSNISTYNNNSNNNNNNNANNTTVAAFLSINSLNNNNNNNSTFNVESEKNLCSQTNTSARDNKTNTSYSIYNNNTNPIQNNYQHLLQLINNIQPLESKQNKKYPIMDIRVQMKSTKFKQFQQAQQQLRQQSNPNSQSSNGNTFSTLTVQQYNQNNNNSCNNASTYTNSQQQQKNQQNRLLNSIIKQKRKMHDFILHHEVFINSNKTFYQQQQQLYQQFNDSITFSPLIPANQQSTQQQQISTEKQCLPNLLLYNQQSKDNYNKQNQSQLNNSNQPISNNGNNELYIQNQRIHHRITSDSYQQRKKQNQSINYELQNINNQIQKEQNKNTQQLQQKLQQQQQQRFSTQASVQQQAKQNQQLQIQIRKGSNTSQKNRNSSVYTGGNLCNNTISESIINYQNGNNQE